eukprot:COSAG02_NODE_7347_length_3053_cov_4.215978_3_plen_189_part_00
MNQPVDDVNRLAAESGIDIVQLHGDEDNAYMEAVAKPVMKVVHVPAGTTVDMVPTALHTYRVSTLSRTRALFTHCVLALAFPLYLQVMEHQAMVEGGRACAVLLDTKVGGSAAGGTGKTFDWGVATAIQGAGLPLFVAGGLKPTNVADAVTTVRPLAVDVSSGVESDDSGKKDPAMVEAFVHGAKAAI